MNKQEIMKLRPAKGNKFIYRYYDSDGSYVGQTKKTLKERAGKNGKNYLTNENKWSEAIKQKGFDNFEVEILCECPEKEADNREKEFIKKFNSMKKGYNSTPGGNYYNPEWEEVSPLTIHHRQNLEKFKMIINARLLSNTIIFPDEENPDVLILFTPYKNSNGIRNRQGILWAAKFSKLNYEMDEISCKLIDCRNKDKWILNFSIFGDNFENDDEGYSFAFEIQDLFDEFLKDVFFELLYKQLNPMQRLIQELHNNNSEFVAELSNPNSHLVKQLTCLFSRIPDVEFKDKNKENRTVISIMKRFNYNKLSRTIILNNHKYTLNYIYLEGLKDSGYLCLEDEKGAVCCLDSFVINSYITFLNPEELLKKKIKKFNFDNI